jgi:hypothetical protein
MRKRPANLIDGNVLEFPRFALFESTPETTTPDRRERFRVIDGGKSN